MAISCQKCGRQYDVTLFEFGRTIDCACGARVGFEHRINLRRADGEPKFFADVNVARLARWLRAAGFDTAWEDAIADAALVRRATLENRFVLTLDKRLPKEWRADHILLLQSEKTDAQFAEVVNRLQLKSPRAFFSRCLACNSVLRAATVEEIAEGAPPKIRESAPTFRFCTRCRKIYWEGSHTARMRAAISEIFSAST